MNVTQISCYFATSYGAYTSGLRQALERRLGTEVRVVASNCGCGDPVELRRDFEDRRCVFVEYPNVPYFRSSNPLKFGLRRALRNVIYGARARRYDAHARGAQVVHFQQTLNAFGAIAVFKWLERPSPAARVVTVHELAPYQLDVPGSNVAYNKADRILVHAGEMRDRLVELGVRPDLIELIHHGVDIGPMPDGPREGLVFYGGHFPMKNKGLDTLIKAMVVVKGRLGAGAPRLTVHGHYGVHGPHVAMQMAAELGVGDLVRWINQVPLAEATAEYRKAALCVVPYVGSFGGFPAALALANGAPVIATKRAGLPEHLGDVGTWVPDNDAEALAAAILRLLGDDAARARLARAGRERAEKVLSWDAVAERTLAVYEAALAQARERTRSATAG